MHSLDHLKTPDKSFILSILSRKSFLGFHRCLLKVSHFSLLRLDWEGWNKKTDVYKYILDPFHGTYVCLQCKFVHIV